MVKVQFCSDNLIYNRYDIIAAKLYKTFFLETQSERFEFQYYVKGNIAYINVWGKEFLQDIFEEAVEAIAEREQEIDHIEVIASGNNYHDQLDAGIDVLIKVNQGTEKIWKRLSAKGRHDLKKKRERLEKEFGQIEIQCESVPISDDTIELYFAWKGKTHGRDYHLAAQDYIEKYHVTDVLKLIIGRKCISMVLYCRCEDTAYLENLSYDTEYAKYSPGTLAYLAFLLELERTGVNYIYLGRAGLAYKKRFGAIEYKRYYGTIYCRRVFERINSFFTENHVKSVSIYGLGTWGRKFLSLKENLSIDLLYGIDQNVKECMGIDVIPPDKLFEAAKPDMVIITLGDRNSEVERIIAKTKSPLIYIYDLLEGIGGGKHVLL